MGGTSLTDAQSLGANTLNLVPPNFVMGPFRVLPDGRLMLKDPQLPPGFHCVWQHCSVKVGLREHHLAVRAILGRVPSTISSSPAVRQAIFDMLRSLVAEMPSGWRLHLLADHCVAVDVESPLPEPPTATELLTTLTMFVLTLQPYLDLSDEAGMEPAGGAAGTAKA